MRDRITTAAYARAVSNCGIDSSNRKPRPELAPDCSAKTAPITATMTAILAPVNTLGSAAGSSTWRNVRQRVASKVRISLISSPSTAANPASVVITIEKKDTSAMTRSLGSRPKPSQSTSTGARIGIGIVWEAISSG